MTAQVLALFCGVSFALGLLVGGVIMLALAIREAK